MTRLPCQDSVKGRIKQVARRNCVLESHRVTCPRIKPVHLYDILHRRKIDYLARAERIIRSDFYIDFNYIDVTLDDVRVSTRLVTAAIIRALFTRLCLIQLLNARHRSLKQWRDEEKKKERKKKSIPFSGRNKDDNFFSGSDV